MTDADSRIMPVAGGGFEQAYNAQALAADSLLVVTNDVVQAPNASGKSSRRWKRSTAFPRRWARPRLLADSGYFERLRRGRDRAVDHARPGTPSSLLEGPLRRRAAAPGEPDAAGSDDTSTGDARGPATLAQANAGTGVRHHPAMGFRQFSLRGLDKVTGEWNLVTLAWNIKRMFTLQYA